MSTDADLITKLREILQEASGDAICDACLALACAVSLMETRELTAALVRAEPQKYQQAPMCTSCCRTAPSIMYGGQRDSQVA
jgi:hypothetical protein